MGRCYRSVVAYRRRKGGCWVLDVRGLTPGTGPGANLFFGTDGLLRRPLPPVGWQKYFNGWNMEIIETYPLNWLGKAKITALDDRVIFEYANLKVRYTREYLYGEINPNVLRGKRGESRWGGLGFVILAIGVIQGVFSRLIVKRSLISLVLLCVSVLLCIAFNLVAFMKKEIICFYQKNGELAFEVICDRNDPMKEEIAKFIIEKTQVGTKDGTGIKKP